MLYYNQISQQSPQYSLNFNGTSQYLLSQTTVQGGVDFVQWERTQAWTIFVRFKITSYATDVILTVFSSLPTLTNFKGIFLGLVSSNQSLNLNIASSDTNRIVINTGANTILLNTDCIMQITYDGSSNANNLLIKINNVVVPYTVAFNSLTTTIIGGQNNFVLGRFFTQAINIPRFLNGHIRHISFVDYVKGSTELIADFNAKKQSVGTGSWLLSPIEPIYKDDGSKQIRSLSTTNINNPLPNPNAFVNEQGYKLNLFNYPTTLIKGTDLIKL